MTRAAAATAAGYWRRRVASLRGRMRRDDGMTLIELTVGMTLTAIFMVMFTGSILMITRSMNTSQAINEASAQVNAAFLRIDEAARSASYFSAPRLVDNKDWYVEMRSLDPAGKELCTQYRVLGAEKQLQSRTWTAAKPAGSGWISIASGITNSGPATAAVPQPFVRVLSKDANLYQQLTVTLVPPAGPGVSATSAASRFTVTALNSTAGTSAPGFCQQVPPL